VTLDWRRLVALAAAAPLVLATAPVLAAASVRTATPVRTAAPAALVQTAFVDRFSTEGWGDVRMAGAAVLHCADPAPTCPANAVTSRVDVDADPSTYDSSRAELLVPPGATVVWAGLYWSGDEAAVDGRGALRCDMTGAPTPAPRPAPTTPAPIVQPQRSPRWPVDPWPTGFPWPWPSFPPVPSLPPAPSDEPTQAPTTEVPTLPPPPADVEAENRVLLKINDGPYDAIEASSFSRVSGPGRTGYQAYAEITPELAMAPPAQPTPVTLTVADLSAGPGLACNGGWTVTMVYAYPDGPDPRYAPTYQSLVVFDGVLSSVAPGAQIALNGVAAAGGAARLSVALYGGGHAPTGAGLTLGAHALAPGAGDAGSDPGMGDFGYRALSAGVPVGSIAAGTTAATLVLPPAPAAYLAGVVAVAQAVPVAADLSVDASFAPAIVATGATTSLTVTVHNGSSILASGVAVTLALPADVTVVAAPTSYVVSTGTWRADRVPGGGDSTLTLQLRPRVAGSLAATAEVSAAQLADSDSQSGDANPDQDDYATAALTVTGPALLGGRTSTLTGAALLVGAALFVAGATMLVRLRPTRRRPAAPVSRRS
jgi:hypothetical protein